MLDDHAPPKVRDLRDTEDPEQGLFVLNLENVQGRERDVILLGTSFDPEEMRDPNSLGMIHLKTFLERARQLNRTVDEPGVEQAPATSRFIGELADRLRAEGLRVITTYGRSQFKVDLAISNEAHPDEWLVAVLVDGSEWASRPLASDRDALPTLILRNIMGWQKVARVWLAAWRLEPDQIVADLVDMVAAASKERGQAPIAPIAPVVPVVPVAPVAVLASVVAGPGPAPEVVAPSYPGAETFFVYADRKLAYLKDVLVGLPPQASDTMRQLVSSEGPIFRDSALKRVAYMFGVGKVSAKMLATLQPLANGFVTTDGGAGVVLWPPDRSAATWRGFRPSTREQREIFEVCPEELINAMASIAGVSMGIGAEDLLRATTQVFGVKSLTEKVRAHVQSALDLALQRRQLVAEDGHLIPGGR